MIQQQYRDPVVVALFALFSWWLVSVTEQEEELLKVETENSIAYFSNDYGKKQMNADGQVKNYLLADSMIHYSGDGTTHLKKPVMTLYNGLLSPWVIQSENGVLMADGENLLLKGKVQINREAAKGVKALNIHTSELRVNLPTNYAETKKWTKIISPPNRTTGIGMKVTFVEPIHLRLLSKVKGRYVLH